MSLKKLKTALLSATLGVAAVFVAAPTAADAGTLDLSAYGWSAAFDDNVDLTILSTSTGGIVLSLQKFAAFDDTRTSTGEAQPLSIVFRQVSRNAVPFIHIEEESVINDMSLAWTGFRFILEGGIAGNTPTFDVDASSSFSTDPFPNKTWKNGNKELLVDGGILNPVSNPPQDDEIWRPGRESGALVINANPFSSGRLAQTFVFKEQPILIPLPAAAWTSLSGLLAVGLLVGAKHTRRILA